MSERIAPCSWPEPLCPDRPDKLTEEQYEELKASAAQILWSLTGSRFGLCEVTSEPAPGCACRGMKWCVCGGSCTLLLDGPVHDVLSVVVNGAPFFDWSLRGSTLYATSPWPEDTVVVYQRGVPWPPGASSVIGELAHQLALSACNSSDCKLPAGLRSRSRQGDTLVFVDVFTQGGRTGLQAVDLWIKAQRETTGRARVWSPDVPVRIDTVTHPASGASA